MISNGRLIIDEAGLEYDNRKMAMTADEIYFFKYHRHYQLDVDFFSQGLDVDIKIRKLARHIYLIKPSLLPFFIKRKEIGRRVGINDMTKEICDEYFFVPFLTGGTKLIFCPPGSSLIPWPGNPSGKGMASMVKPPPHGWGFSLAHRKAGDIRIYPPP